MGLIDCVLATRSGWIDKVEVVEAVFDPGKIAYEKLLARAQDKDIASIVFPRDEKQAAAARARAAGRVCAPATHAIREQDLKYHLARTPLRFVPMTDLQALRVNALLAAGKSAEHLLSPWQLKILAAAKRHEGASWKSAIGIPIVTAWPVAEATVAVLPR